MIVDVFEQNFFNTNHSLAITHSASGYGYQPLVTGNIVPSFTISTKQGLLSFCLGTSVTRESIISLQDFIDYGQPLVVLFLGFSTRAALSIARLELLQQQIQKEGGKLLVLTPIEQKHWKRYFKGSHSLSIFHDEDNTIAESFGLFDEQNPLWQWVSGIESEEEVLPAVYVIAPDRRIVYHHVDFDFVLSHNSDYGALHFTPQLLEAVHYIAQPYHPEKRYKLVS